MQFNRPEPRKVLTTHEGAPAQAINPEQQLRRSVLSCLLWEKEFYEDGQQIADRITWFAALARPSVVAALAVEARNVFGLRHAPLLLLLDLIGRPKPLKDVSVAGTIAATIRRPDEMMELLALYWRDGKKPLSAQLKKGLAQAFLKFSEYSLAKYDRDGKVKLRDVMFLVRPKPQSEEQAALFKRVADKQLVTPDTWEVALSGGADKKETFTRLLEEGKLGYLALLRNLRNMTQANVDDDLIRNAILQRKGAELVFPFRYVAAARAVPSLEPDLDVALLWAIRDLPQLPGTTAVLIDVSGSMDHSLSSKSDMTRMDAAAALGAIVNAERLRLFSFSEWVQEIPPRRGMSGVDAIIRSQPHNSTYLGRAVIHVNSIQHDRLIVITDEQSHDIVPAPYAKRAYMINVASSKNGVGYRNGWIHIDGFSESVLRYISELERGEG